MIYPHVLANLIPSPALPKSLQVYWPKYPCTLRQKERLPRVVTCRRLFLLRRSVVLGLLLILALAVVRFNTVIHPFTLADNRHYIFYVFRLLSLRPWVRYIATPVYIFCGWAVLLTLCEPCAPNPSGKPKLGDQACLALFDWWWRPQQAEYWETNQIIKSTSDAFMTTSALAWLATSSLTLVTAPLVEPRYFILPWIFWRLDVRGPPVDSDLPSSGGEVSRQAEASSRLVDIRQVNEALTAADAASLTDFSILYRHGDHRLWLETFWFLLINCATGYLFLYRGFHWPQEPNQIQRFMW